MVSGGVLSSLIALIINTYYTGKLIKGVFFVQMKDLIPIVVISIIMWIFIHVSILLIVDASLQLLVGIMSGLSIYLVLAKYFLKSEWNYLLSMIPNRYKK